MRRTIIIAEAGINHNGSIEIAKRLIDAAVEAGVDYIKFQTYITENLVLHDAEQAQYQRQNIGDQESCSQYDMLKRHELSFDDHYHLIEYCNKCGIKFLSTAFDFSSIDFLGKLKLDLWKIPSGEITNYPYLCKVAQYGEPVILSTGMCELADVDSAVLTLRECGLKPELITILHCNTQYPTPFQDVNLRAMLELRNRYNLNVGYSDHTIGIEVPIAAVALGASVIEKHFTLSRTMKGPDHKASLEPAELRRMVEAIRNVENALGDGHKKITDSERENIVVARKSIVAQCYIPKGARFTEQNLTVKRPGTGISPMLWNDVIGKEAKRDFNADELIEI